MLEFTNRVDMMAASNFEIHLQRKLSIDDEQFLKHQNWEGCWYFSNYTHRWTWVDGLSLNKISHEMKDVF